MLTAKSIDLAANIDLFYPDFEPPSPENPSRPLRVSLERRNRFALRRVIFDWGRFGGKTLDEADDLAGKDNGEKGIEDAFQRDISQGKG